MDKRLVQELLPLVNSLEWERLQAWVEQERLQILKEVETAQSEQALFRCQGRLGSLRQVLTLKDDCKKYLKA